MPASKWLPIYKGAEPWEVITFPPAFDELGRRLAPKPPEGTIIDWWKMPKDTWPLEAPWEPKVFGCWPASKITMSEDLKPSIWPGPHRSPPFGFIKLKMPGEKDTTGLQIPFTNFKIHMRPEFDHFRVMARHTPMGIKYFLYDQNWDLQEYEYKKYRAALKTRKQEQFMEMLADEIRRTNSERKRPTKDLF
jgi:hypothetical protein